MYPDATGFGDRPLRLQVKVEKDTISFSKTNLENVTRWLDLENAGLNQNVSVTNQPEGVQFVGFEYLANNSVDKWSSTAPSDAVTGDHRVRAVFTYNPEIYTVDTQNTYPDHEIKVNGTTIYYATNYVVRERTFEGTQIAKMTPGSHL